MGPMVCVETWVTIYKSVLRKIPEERRSHLHQGGSLRSRILPTLHLFIWEKWSWIMRGLRNASLARNATALYNYVSPVDTRGLVHIHVVFKWNKVEWCGPGSSVSIATGYGLDGPGIESRCGGEIFHTCPDRPCGPPSLLYNGYRVFPGG
jgi:hypothetical protein